MRTQHRVNIRHDNQTARRRGTTRLQRMFKHIYKSLRQEGVAHHEAIRIAASTVNKFRAEHGITIESEGRAIASRHGWWPGRKRG